MALQQIDLSFFSHVHVSVNLNKIFSEERILTTVITGSVVYECSLLVY